MSIIGNKRKRKAQKRFSESDDLILLGVLRDKYKNWGNSRLQANWKDVQMKFNKELNKNGVDKKFDTYQVNQHWLRVLSKKVDSEFEMIVPYKKQKIEEKEIDEDTEEKFFTKEDELSEIETNYSDLLFKTKNVKENFFESKYYDFDILRFVVMNIDEITGITRDMTM